jgi:phenylacetate-coenzyme A ligase PaaK-like adenylate-forming protein
MNILETIRFTGRMLYRARMARAEPRRVEQLQEARLRRLLMQAVERSRFYREKFQGIDIARCPLEELPVTTKAEMMERFDDLVTDPEITRRDLEKFVENPENVGKLYLGRYPVCHTSGSLGQSLLVVQNLRTIELMFGFQMTRGNVGYRVGPVEAVRRFFRPGHVMIIINRPGFFPSAWIFQQIPPALRPYVRFSYVAGSDPELEEKFRRFKPLALVGTPSALDVLALRADRLDLSNLRQVTAMSETLTAGARARIERAFGATVIDNYSSGECFFLSNGCRRGKGMHLNADWAVLENVDERNRPVPPGVLGAKALMTNLANTIQPFIRYEVADRIVMADSDCGCGNRLPRIERVEGRSADFFWIRVGDDYRALLTYPFQHAFEFLRNIREWQAVQQDRNRIVVRLECLPGTAVDLEQVRARLDERLNSVGLAGHVEVEFEVVGRLDWDTRTGKFRRLVTLIGPPHDLSSDRPLGATVRNGDERADMAPSLIGAEAAT